MYVSLDYDIVSPRRVTQKPFTALIHNQEGVPEVNEGVPIENLMLQEYMNIDNDTSSDDDDE